MPVCVDMTVSTVTLCDCIGVLLSRVTTEASTPLSDDGFSQKCPAILNQNFNGITSSPLMGKGLSVLIIFNVMMFS